MARCFSEREIKLIDYCSDICTKVSETLREIKAGKSMKQACKDSGFGYIRFRRLLESLYRVENANVEFPEDVLNASYNDDYGDDYSFAERFYADVFDVGVDGASSVMPEDADTTIDFVLSEFSDREREIVRMYYDGFSYRKIGKTIGISHERVRTIKKDVMRQMRNPKRKAVLTVGKAEYEKGNAVRENVKSEDVGRLVFESYKNRLNLGSQLSVPDSTSIDVLGLGVRAYNALRNAQILTVGDLKTYTARDILGFRNVGIGVLCDVVAKAAMFGIFFVGMTD